MNDMIDTMRSWVLEHEAGGAGHLGVSFRASPQENAKQAGWVEFDSPDAMGQLILWETGECEIDVGSLDGERSIIRSATVKTRQELVVLLNEVADFFG
ncbi:immunity protein TriTu family protein [Amycolatopsis nigrescens]|uniref:immunity protein TriTu family protein n=1 Tax=Amycolatopsis nigrescens TaxID=381445 RepID=UPI0012F82877|nr:hypothetical protein [Amycolatopsis nigrescens]